MSPPSSRTQTLVMTERMMIWWSIIFSIIFIHAVGLLSGLRKVHVHKITEKIKTIVSENDFAGMISRTWTTRRLLSLSSQELVREE